MLRCRWSVCILGFIVCLIALSNKTLTAIATTPTLFGLAATSSSVAYFSDEFDQPYLSQQWFWINEDPSNWTLAARPGYLRINTQYGTLDDNPPINILLTTTPADEYEVLTRVEINPTQNYHEAALLLYNDENNYIKLSRLYHSSFGGDIYLFLQEINGIHSIGFITQTTQQISEMRIRILDNSAIGAYRDTLGEWVELGRIQLDEGIRYTYTGITAHNGVENDAVPSIYADFDFFQLNRVCAIPFFSQVDDNWRMHPLLGSCSEWCVDPQAGFVTIGRCGCTLTSAAMVFNTYGAYTNPAQLSDCMGTSACPYAWLAGASCSQNKARWISRPNFDWNVLDQQVNQYHRPVILGMHRKGSPDDTHWVVVLSGKGNDPENYRIHDPAFKCGANITLSTRFQDYDFDYLGIYASQVPCSSLLTLTPPCVSRGTNPQPVITSTMNLNTPLYDPSMASPSVISGTVWLYTMTEITMTVEIMATSSVGTIEEMLIWSDSMSNTTWQPFTPFVWLPVSEFVYAQFKDNLGNVTGVYSDTIYPSGPPTGPVPLQVFLPLVIRH